MTEDSRRHALGFLRQIAQKVRARMKKCGFNPSGNCFSAALAAGTLVSKGTRGSWIVRMYKAVIRDTPHYYVQVITDHGDTIYVDPTFDQFDPRPTESEYQSGVHEPIDLLTLSLLLED